MDMFVAGGILPGERSAFVCVSLCRSVCLCGEGNGGYGGMMWDG